MMQNGTFLEGIWAALGTNLQIIHRRSRTTSAFVQEVCGNLNSCSSPEQWRIAGGQLVETYEASAMPQRRSILVDLSQNFGVDHASLRRAIVLYQKNEQAFMTVGSAARPHYFRLFQSIGNIADGVKRICSMRADVLAMLRASDLTRIESAALRPVETCLRELLMLWFCQCNLRLQQLTLESPADVLAKIVKYEAVHPITDLMDMQQRLGSNRRCFVFMHEAMDREPLIVVYTAFMKQIAEKLEEIMNVPELPNDESVNDTAVFYSISSTQPGLRGIDLGNMLIKRVIAEISNTNPHIKVFATLSPMPTFRSWLLRSLKCAAPSGSSGDVIDERVTALCEENEFFKGETNNVEVVRLFLLDHLNKVDLSKFEEVSEIILHLAVRYLVEIKHCGTGCAFDPVANFHLRNGAEIYALNWKANVTQKGLESSFGVMVNYRYRLDQVIKNSTQYIQEKQIAVNSGVLKFL